MYPLSCRLVHGVGEAKAYHPAREQNTVSAVEMADLSAKDYPVLINLANQITQKSAKITG